MKEKRKRILPVIFLIFLIPASISIFLFGFFWDHISFDDGLPHIQYPIYNFYTTVMGQDGYIYTVVNGKSAVLKTNEKGKISGIIENDNYRGNDSFSEANQICCDSDGNLYVADLEWSESGFYVARERVLMYNSLGFFKKEIYCRDYGGDPPQKSHLLGLKTTKDGISFLMTDDKKISVYSSKSGNKAKLESEIPYDEVSFIQDAVVGADGQTVYFTDKLCNVYGLSLNGKKQILMSADNLPEFTVPYHLSADENNLIYVTDIGNEQVYTVSENHPEKIYCSMENKGLEILQNISVSDGMILLTTDSSALMLDSKAANAKTLISVENISGYTPIWIMIWVLQILFLLVGIIGAAALIIQIMMFLYKNNYFKRFKFSIIGTLGILLTAILILPMVLSNFREIYFNSYQNEVYLLADIAANTIDAETFLSINKPTDYNSDAYKELRQSMESIIDRENKYGDNIYINLTRLDNDRAYAMLYLDDSIGAYYPVLGEERELLEQVYSSRENGHTDDAADVTGSYTYVVAPVIAKDGTVAGAVEVGMDLNAMQNQISEISTDVIISLALMIIIGVFLLNETVSFLHNREEHKNNSKVKEKVPLHELRIITMLCFTALNMPTAFMPVYLESLHYKGLFLSQTQCGTIPLTVNFALMAVMALFCAPIVRRFSFRKTAMAGAAICMLGDISLAMSSFAFAFIGLILNGLGLGLLLNVLTICVSGFKSEEEKNKGFAITTSASLSGMLCGTVIGANLAKYVGESNMFWFSTALWLAELLICYRMGGHFNEFAVVPKQETQNKMTWYKFLAKPSIMFFILFVEFPAAVMSCFCSYFVPLFAASINMNEVRTSLIVIINSLVGSLASVLFADAVLKKLRNNAIYIMCAVSAGAILLFAWSQNLLTLIIAMITLGLAESIGVPARSTCYCMNKNSINYGEDRAMGIYNFSDNAGNSAGTSILGALLGLGTSLGLTIVTASSAGVMGLYYLIFDRKNKKE